MQFEYLDVSYDELTAPKVLYKYRFWDNLLHKDILTKRLIYMAAPSEFEDWKDCLINRERFNLTPNDVINGYFTISKQEHPEYSIETHMALAVELANQCDIDELSLDIINDYVSQNKNIGILSLSKRNNNIIMWNKYANNGTGFCVGIDTRYLYPLMKRGADVHYYDVLPNIDITEDINVQIWKHIFCKERCWEFEQEYRTLLYKKNGLNNTSRLVRLPKEAFVEIIFGYNISPENKKKIVNVCKSTGLKPNLLQSRLVDDTLYLQPV